MWKNIHERRKNEGRFIKKLQPLENSVKALLENNQRAALPTRISRLENAVRTLLENNQNDVLRDTLAEILQQEINVLADAARTADILEAEIFWLGGVRRALDGSIHIPYTNSPPDLPNNNDYWRDLSCWMREEKQWTCEKCGINLENRQSDLHVHHIFGKGFNSPQHLKVLCIECHAEEEGHDFMKRDVRYTAFLEWKRRLK